MSHFRRGSEGVSWSWKDVYPGARMVTLVLDAFEAAELLDQAREEGRLIAPDTVRGMPAIAFADVGPEQPDEQKGTDDEEAAEEAAPQVAVEPESEGEGSDENDLPEAAETRRPLPASPRHGGGDRSIGGRGVAGPDRTAPAKLMPPTPRPAPAIGLKRLSPADQALIDAAIAEGRVTKCPPMKHSVPPGQLLPCEEKRWGKRGGNAGPSNPRVR